MLVHYTHVCITPECTYVLRTDRFENNQKPLYIIMTHTRTAHACRILYVQFPQVLKLACASFSTGYHIALMTKPQFHVQTAFGNKTYILLALRPPTMIHWYTIMRNTQLQTASGNEFWLSSRPVCLSVCSCSSCFSVR